MTGYFYLSRGLFDHPLFISNDPLSQREAWIWLIEHANFATQQFRVGMHVFDVPRGSIGTHYRELARQFRWSVNRVIRVLNLFQKQGMIVLKTEQQWVQITLCNYERYQDRRNGDGTLAEQQRDGDGTATDTKISKVKKESKGKNTPKPPSAYSPEFEEFWIAYPPHHGEKKPALEAYLKSTKGVDHARILEGARRYADQRAGDRRPEASRFTKHPSTWLNQCGWENESQPHAAAGGGTVVQPGGVFPAARPTYASEAERAKQLIRDGLL